MKKRNRGGEGLRNRLLVLMLGAAVVLVVIIAVTTPEQDAPPENTSQSVHEGESEPEGDPESDPENGSSSNGESKAESGSSSNSESKPEGGSSSPGESKATGESSSSKPEAADDKGLYYEAAMPILVNPHNKLPDNYKPEVEVIGNGCSYSYDRTALVAYRAMAAAAKAEGITLSPVSAYRSHEKQTTNFNNKQKEYENMGYTPEKAYAATAQLIAVPGTSEHELGLAIDLNSLETSFEETKTFKWLFANCAEYGFILRYPKDKTEITEISYEPWHYRYVGSNHAKLIMEQGICLEEYLNG